MERVLNDAGLRDDLRARGLRRAREFSWDHTARRVRAIYDEVLAG
jgi:glycosyltransferase involved in cell wall biosynthesis